MANPNTCVATEDGAICDVDQAIHNDDAVLNTSDEPLNLSQSGWIYTGTAFKVPNFAQNGAQPLTRISYAPLSIHGAYLPGDEQNALLANGAVSEGVLGYAWSTQSQPGTVPVYRYERGFPNTNIAYTTDKAQGDGWVQSGAGWVDKGIAFYAYPPNYVPAPTATASEPSAAITKDDNCTQSNLKISDKGECVIVLKKMLIGIGLTKDHEKSTNEMGTDTDNLVRFAINTLRDQGKTAAKYDGVVSLEVWQALEFALAAKVNPPTPTITACPQTPGDAGLKEFLEGTAAGKKYDDGCVNLWKLYFESKKQPVTVPAPTATPAQPAAQPAPAIDKDCDTASMTIGAQGGCVKLLHGMLNYLGAGQVSTKTDVFTDATNNAVLFTVRTGSVPGVAKGDYTGTVTKAIWDGITTLVQAQPAPTPPIQEVAEVDNGLGCTKATGNDGLKEFLEGSAAGKKYSPGCISIWQQYISTKNLCGWTGTCSFPDDRRRTAVGSNPTTAGEPVGTCTITDENYNNAANGSVSNFTKDQPEILVLNWGALTSLTKDDCKNKAVATRATMFDTALPKLSSYFLATWSNTVQGKTEVKCSYKIKPNWEKSLYMLVNTKYYSNANWYTQNFKSAGFSWHQIKDKGACDYIGSEVIRKTKEQYNVNKIKSYWK